MARNTNQGTGTGAATRERVLIDEPQRYKVILHNADFTTMEFVTGDAEGASRGARHCGRLQL